MQILPSKVVKLYLVEEWSLRDIAKIYNTNANKIRRILSKEGVTMRDHSAAQKLHLKNGGPHPTKGKHRTDEEKMAISKSSKNTWSEKSDEEKEELLKAMQEGLKKSKKGDNSIKKKAEKKMLETRLKGSQLEKYVYERLKKDGFRASYHTEYVMGNDLMEYDIFVSMDKKIAIEIDGPTHLRPLFGEERFKNQIESDQKKDRLTITKKTHMLRVFADYTNLPLWKKDAIYNLIVDKLKELDKDDEYRVSKIGKVEK